MEILSFIKVILFSAILIWVFIEDFRQMLIPTTWVYLASGILLVLNVFLVNFSGVKILFFLMAGVAGWLFFALQYYFSGKKWVGAGDLSLGWLIGITLGIFGLLLTLFLAYLIGGLVAIFLLSFKKVKRGTAWPLGIFLAPSALVIMFFGTLLLRSLGF